MSHLEKIKILVSNYDFEKSLKLQQELGVDMGERTIPLDLTTSSIMAMSSTTVDESPSMMASIAESSILMEALTSNPEPSTSMRASAFNPESSFPMEASTSDPKPSSSVKTSTSSGPNVSPYPRVDERVRSRYGPEVIERKKDMTPEARKKLIHALNERIRRPERRREQDDKIRAPLLEQIRTLQEQVVVMKGANMVLSEHLAQLFTPGYQIQCANCLSVLSGLRLGAFDEDPDPTDTTVLRRVSKPL